MRQSRDAEPKRESRHTAGKPGDGDTLSSGSQAEDDFRKGRGPSHFPKYVVIVPLMSYR